MNEQTLNKLSDLTVELVKTYREYTRKKGAPITSNPDFEKTATDLLKDVRMELIHPEEYPESEANFDIVFNEATIQVKELLK